ncbi:hypothetical protein N7495_002601 [Penicillium taxi]|uniref:uncharacterized protein n=1 Tax=Penicillium taxi TaxID=168475 RepID=UPI00254529E3|nr:uncharacterized protein N7495_002601 [Penicillium taxi]KAJ5902073.1 hypothetical protein N7495_002601 [Penicillium taxi]
MDHAFLFCDTHFSTGFVDIISSKTPFFLDPWTGTEKPVLNYRRLGDRITIPLSLAGNQTVIIGFSDNKQGLSGHVTKLPSTVIGYDYSKTGTNLHIAFSSTNQSLKLAMEQKSAFQASVSPDHQRFPTRHSSPNTGKHQVIYLTQPQLRSSTTLPTIFQL